MNDKKKQIEEEAEKRYPYAEVTKFNEGYIANRHKAKVDGERMRFIEAANFGMGMKDEWISVKDSLPNKDTRVIVMTDNKEVGIGYRTKLLYLRPLDKSDDKVRWVAVEPIADYHEIVLWMPLPSPPKKTP